MKLRVALAGELNGDAGLFSKIDVILGQISGYMETENCRLSVEAVVSPDYTGKGWQEFIAQRTFSVQSVSRTGTTAFDIPRARTLELETSIRPLAGESVCNKSDIAVVCWNEDVTEMSGATWEFLYMAYKRRLPCVWISTKSQKAYCLDKTYYRDFSVKYLSDRLEPLSPEVLPEQPQPLTGIMAFWKKLRSGYLKKYKADAKAYPPIEDKRFKSYDSAAIAYNEKYQTVLYARSILPLITTVFLAIGFYAETLIGKTWSYFSPNDDMAQFASHFALILAGAGFLVHGFLNLYVYRMSVSKKIAGWHYSFTENRFMAELYRLLLRLTPYGADLNLRKLCDDGSKDGMGRMNVLLHTDDDSEAGDKRIDKKSVRELLSGIDGMLEEQIEYHAASVKRYEGIVSSLQKWSRVIFYASFAMILLRALLQFVLALSPLSSVNGFDLNAWIRSFANFLALFLPAWAGYFTSKREQNNFAYNLENHRRMKSELTDIRERVKSLIENENTGLEDVYSLTDDLTNVMIAGDTLEWKRKYRSSTVKPL